MLIVDDHAGFRKHARALFAAAGFEIVGEAPDASSGVRAAVELSPDVVLLDIQLPDGTGFEVAEEVLAGAQPPAIVLISSREASEYGRRIERSGARGFITKMDLSAGAVEALLRTEP